jgi:hypothetical protein
MCPACVASAAAWIVGGTMSTSGITALAVRVLGNKKQRAGDGYAVDPKQVYVQPTKAESACCSGSENNSAPFDKLVRAI